MASILLVNSYRKVSQQWVPNNRTTHTNLSNGALSCSKQDEEDDGKRRTQSTSQTMKARRRVEIAASKQKKKPQRYQRKISVDADYQKTSGTHQDQRQKICVKTRGSLYTPGASLLTAQYRGGGALAYPPK